MAKLIAYVSVAIGFTVGFTAFTALLIYSAFAHAFVMSKVWTWYLCPAGFVLPSMKTFVGVRLLFGMLHSMTREPRETKLDNTEYGLAVFIFPWMGLFLAYILHLWFN